MLRSIFSIVAVALLAGWINQAEHAGATATAQREWVRTAAGWEPRHVVEHRPSGKAAGIHPGLVAAFQLTASLLFLLAFPTRVRLVSMPVERRMADRRRTAKAVSGRAASTV